MSKVKIGSARLVGGEYIITSEYANINGSEGKFFKDEEAYENNWDAPCYAEEAFFDDSETTEEYWTHLSLLEACGYNEKLCDTMFKELSWQCPDTWLNELESEDYAYFWNWMKPGVKAFYNWNGVCEDVYPCKIVRIDEDPQDWYAKTSVWILMENPDMPGSDEEAEVCLWDLMGNNVYHKYLKKQTGYYKSFIFPNAKVYFTDPAEETSGFYYVGKIEGTGNVIEPDTIVWLKNSPDDKAWTNQVCVDELSKGGSGDENKPLAILRIHNTDAFDKAVWQSRPDFKEEQYNEWLQSTAVKSLQSIYDIIETSDGVSPDDMYVLGDVINMLSKTKIKIK